MRELKHDDTLGKILDEIAAKFPELPLLFSGGVFQNRVLVEKIIEKSKQMERLACFQHETALNDGGISLGQTWYALHNLCKKNAV